MGNWGARPADDGDDIVSRGMGSQLGCPLSFNIIESVSFFVRWKMRAELAKWMRQVGHGGEMAGVP